MDVCSIPQFHKKENATDVVVNYNEEANHFQNLSLFDHHDQKNKNLGDDDYDLYQRRAEAKKQRVEETRIRRSVLLASGYAPADLFDDDAADLADQANRMQRIKLKKARRAANKRTTCGRPKWYCWCNPGGYPENSKR